MPLRLPVWVQILPLTLALGARVAPADVVAVVSSKSTVGSLTKDQVADIFFGKVRRFPNGAVAIPIDLAEDLPERAQFYEKVANKSAAQVKAQWARIIFTGRGQPPKSVPSDIEMKKRLAENPDAIGYIDATQVDASVRVLF
jgi:ABC-type phosphate transport system substrate-binding protein